MVLSAPDAATVTSGPSGTNNYDYTISWTSASNSADMLVAVYRDWSMQQELTKQDGSSFTLSNIETGVEYEFLLKYKKVINGQEYLSPGTVIKYTRQGAQKISDLSLKQIEQADGVTQNIEVTWTPSSDASNYEITYFKEVGIISRLAMTEQAHPSISHWLTEILLIVGIPLPLQTKSVIELITCLQFNLRIAFSHIRHSVR